MFPIEETTWATTWRWAGLVQSSRLTVMDRKKIRETQREPEKQRDSSQVQRKRGTSNSEKQSHTYRNK